MLINTTKTTIQATKIAISYNGNDEYNAILNIITIFRLMKLNIIFEPIEIAGNNYKKCINYGIDENNLTHLKNTNFLFHSPFNYNNFNAKTQIKASDYLDVAMENYFIRYYSIVDDNKIFFKTIFTNYFNKKKKYISNLQDFSNFIDQKESDEICCNYDFSISFGRKYAMFELKKSNDYTTICFIREFLNFVNLQDYSNKIRQFQKLDDVIKYCRKEFFCNSDAEIIEINNSFLSQIKNIKYNIDKEEILYNSFDENCNIVEKNEEFIKIKLKGRYIVSQISNSIKEMKVLLPEGFELHQIMSDDIEFYPNINIWYTEVIEPLIILTRTEKL